MALTAGIRHGAYEIAARIGAGGMGEVYRATDTTLKRQVAIKVLPEAVAANPERLARFQREAEVLASLNHPNIAHIYGMERLRPHRAEDGGIRGEVSASVRDGGGAPTPVETDEAVTALIMELVEGEDLSQRIARGAIPLPDALPIAKQIVEALEAAHEQGIIHRDLKPANIKVKSDGTVKVLDFGLAKAMEPPGAASPSVSMSPTITTPAMTQAGMILGTAAYMSPEQAKGGPADRRSDLWAFGCVLYEMLTGRRAFDGEEVTTTLAVVLMKEPDWGALPAETPPIVQRLLRRCLAKDRRQRLDSAAAVQLDLDDALDTSPAGSPAPGVTPAATTRSRGLPWLVAMAIVALATALLTFAVARRESPEAGLPRVPRQFAIPPPPGVAVADDVRQPVALSADGRVLVIKGVSDGGARFYARRLDQPEFVPVAGSERAASGELGSVFLSPDGAWIGFHDIANGSLSRLPLAGGTPASIVRFSSLTTEQGFLGASWGPDDLIAFSALPPASLMTVPATGGEPQQVALHDGGEVRNPVFLFDERLVAYFVARSADYTGGGSYVLSLDAGQPRRLPIDGDHPRSLGRTHLLFARRGPGPGQVWSVPFDRQAMQVAGTPLPLVEGVGGLFSGSGWFDAATDGSMVYVPSPREARNIVAWVDSQGLEEEIAGLPPGPYELVRTSPDGDYLALGTTQTDHIWIYSLVNRTLSRLVPNVADDRGPVWSPDGQRVLFTSNVEGRPTLFSVPVGGGATERLFTAAEGVTDIMAEGWAPDGETLLFYEGRGGQVDMGILPNGGRGPAEVQSRPQSNEAGARVSPDGRVVAYHANPSGPFDVYVERFPEFTGRVQVSSGGGRTPVWSADSRQLFYIAPDGQRILAAEVEQSARGIVVTGRRTVRTGTYLSGSGGANRVLDLAPDGRLAVIKPLPRDGTDRRVGQVVFLENVIEGVPSPGAR